MVKETLIDTIQNDAYKECIMYCHDYYEYFQIDALSNHNLYSQASL